ncbi:MAG: hypothetical protein LBJ64_06480 [Deltaproteobacteria bacterium]|jgi:hypothetical protein|nr:hypothetical protein [Deltaproteobacteria bacterium]
MPKSYKYKVADTTKAQREKYINYAINISALGAGTVTRGQAAHARLH